MSAPLTLHDGTPVEICPLDERDVDRLVGFFRQVPAEDRLFLREDVAVRDVVYDWVRHYGPDRLLALVAEADDEIVGAAIVERQAAPWSRHVGELWVIVAREARGRGIGHRLVAEGVAGARRLGLEKLVAPMTANQGGAVALFLALGFAREGTLTGHVRDPRRGDRHDLILMAQAVETLADRLAATDRRPGRPAADHADHAD